jgi:hypothetical protein
MGRQCLARNASFLFCPLAKPRFYHVTKSEDAMQSTIHEFSGWQAKPQAFTATMPGVARKK